jgi:hypothetical protein
MRSRSNCNHCNAITMKLHFPSMEPIVDNQFEDAEEFDPIDQWISRVMQTSRNNPQHEESVRKGIVNPMKDHPKISPPILNVSLALESERQNSAMNFMKEQYASEACEKCFISDDSSVDDLSSQDDPRSRMPFQIPEGVTSMDVLCGRGKGASNFIGNRRFRSIVMCYRKAYTASSRRIEKRSICFEIIEKVQNRGGRFLVKKQTSSNSSTKETWVVLSNEKVLIKVSQALREGDTKWNRPKQGNESNGTRLSFPSVMPGISLLAEISSVESSNVVRAKR